MNLFDELKKDLTKEFNETQIEGITCVAIYGSYARGEEVENWSDMDVLIFTNSIKISLDLFKQLGAINIALNKKYPSIPMTFRVHSIDEFPEYVRYESSICPYSLLSYYKDMTVIYGMELNEEIRAVLKRTQISRVIADLKSKIISSRHESRSIITSSNGIQPFTQSFHVPVTIDEPLKHKISKYVDMVLECAICFNILKGELPDKKEMTARIFKEKFGDFEYSNLPLKCSEIRKSWNNFHNFSQEEINKIILDCADFFEKLPDYFDKASEYNQINNTFLGMLVNDTIQKYRKNVCMLVTNGDEFLIVKKPSNEWQFVQGGLEKDEDWHEGIKRELLEETGITNYTLISEAKHINTFDWPEDLQKKKGFKGQEQHFFILKVNKSVSIKLDTNELSEFKWVKFEEIMKFITREDIVESILEIRKEFPLILK